MKKQSFTTILLIVLMSMTGLKTFAHDIEVANADGVTIYYKWINNHTEFAVSYGGSYTYSYSNEYIGNVVIPESIVYEGNNYSVTTIDDCAFEFCYGLTSVTIPKSVTSIGGSAFYGCYGLTSITIPNSVTSIGNSTFEGCSDLTSVHISNSVTSIGERTFFNCSSLTSVTIPNSVTSIGNYAFYDCSGLTSVTIPNSVTSIGNYAFYGCGGLTSVHITDLEAWCNTSFSDNPLNYAHHLYMNGEEIKDLVIPNGVTSIGQSAFSGCSNFTSVTIPNSVASIGDFAFSGCSGLTSVTIPNSVTSIGREAFLGCDGLTSVVIGSGVTTIGGFAFSSNNLMKIIWLTNTPPSGYGDAAGAVNYVSNDQFNISNKVVYKFLSSYFDVDGIRYVPISPSERTCDAIDCVNNESATNTKINSTIVYKGVTMTVMNIKPYLAYNNKYIKTLTIDNDGELADYAFSDCSNLETVVCGEKINRIGKGAFSGCKALTSLTTSEKTKLSNAIYISKNVNIIDDYAFKGCEAIKNIIFMDSDAGLSLGANAIVSNFYSNGTGTPLFSDCPLDSVYIGRNIDYKTTKQYGYSPFYRNTSLRTVKITDKETEISENEFYGCTNLQRVVIGDGVTNIGNWAFSGCQSLKYFAFGSQVTNIGQEAFSDCASVIEIRSKALAAPACGTQALDDINKWDCKLYVPDGCMAVYQAAEQWKDFIFTEEGEGTAGQGSGAHSDNNQKCETPTITIDGNTVKFDCKTNGVIFHYTLSSSEAKSDITNSGIEVKNKYTITVYASKEGYVDSEVARAEFQVAAAGKLGDLNNDGKVDVADHVKLSEIIMNQ